MTIAPRNPGAVPTVAPVQRLAALDALRFMAALGVMFYHYAYSHAPGGAGSSSFAGMSARFGFLGVEIFFLISGFVILWSAHDRTPVQFVRSRLLRLYPEFWISVLLSATFFALIPGGFGQELTPAEVLVNLTMVPGYLGVGYVDGVYWTLEVELAFYGLVFLLLLGRQMKHVEAWLYAWLAVIAIEAVTGAGTFLRTLTIFPYGSMFASGGIFYLVHASGWNWRRAAALLVGLALAINHATASMHDFIFDDHITTTARAIVAGIMVAGFLVFAMMRHLRLRGRTARWALAAGALTYPLYLLHNIGTELFLGTSPALDVPHAIALACAFSLLLAWLVMRASRVVVLPALRGLLDQMLRFARPRVGLRG